MTRQAICALPKGTDLCVDVGHWVSSRLTSGGIVEPVVRMALSLFGRTPATVFNNMDRFFAMAARGFSFRYEERTPSSGVTFAQLEGPGIPRASFEVTRGNLLTVFDLCRTPGTIAPPEVVRHDQAGALVSLAVQWQ